jgi:hypothetical protein
MLPYLPHIVTLLNCEQEVLQGAESKKIGDCRRGVGDGGIMPTRGVTPAKAGALFAGGSKETEVPACAGMTR